MFTGIISATGRVLNHSQKGEILTLVIEKPQDWDIHQGDSISVNGTCLTVVSFDEKTFTFDLMAETLIKTIFGSSVPERVNLEPSVKSGDLMNGHFVLGHIDTTGTITKIQENQITISFPKEFDNLVVEKGSIAVNGVSLSIFQVENNSFTVALIPYTLENTTFGALKENDAVNIEFDIVGKYAAKIYEPKRQ